MNTITHALLPVIAVSLVEKVHRGPERRKVWTNREILAVGACGAAPDLLNPHISLAARYTSWSHGLPAWVGVSILLLVGAMCLRPLISLKLAGWGSLAYGLHLFCDLIAGGIAWRYPFGGEVVGHYWVPPGWWAWIDAACVLTLYFLWRVIPASRTKSSCVVPEGGEAPVRADHPDPPGP